MSPTLFAQVLDPAHRTDPYPLYDALRRAPVGRQDDGTWVVGSHAAAARLLGDPPPCRPGASLRGPRRLRLAVEAPVDAAL